MLLSAACMRVSAAANDRLQAFTRHTGARVPVTHPPYQSVFIRFHPFGPVVLLSAACMRVSAAANDRLQAFTSHTGARAPAPLCPTGRTSPTGPTGRPLCPSRPRVRQRLTTEPPFRVFRVFRGFKKRGAYFLSAACMRVSAISSFISYHSSFERRPALKIRARPRCSSRPRSTRSRPRGRIRRNSRARRAFPPRAARGARSCRACARRRPSP